MPDRPPLTNGFIVCQALLSAMATELPTAQTRQKQSLAHELRAACSATRTKLVKGSGANEKGRC